MKNRKLTSENLAEFLNFMKEVEIEYSTALSRKFKNSAKFSEVNFLFFTYIPPLFILLYFYISPIFRTIQQILTKKLHT